MDDVVAIVVIVGVILWGVVHIRRILREEPKRLSTHPTPTHIGMQSTARSSPPQSGSSGIEPKINVYGELED